MWKSIGAYVGGKLLAAVLGLGVVAVGIWFWRHPEQLRALWQIVKYVTVWIGFVVVLPWALSFVPHWVLKKESNVAAGMMLGGYCLLDVVLALILMGGVSGHGTLTWMVVLVGFLAAAVYNFLVCDYQAERIEQSW